jgi:uncharacterized protein YneF (UPF0154 family)
MTSIKKIWLDSLSFLDNIYIYASILIILFLYSTLIFENINNYIGKIYSYSVIRFIVLLLIIYVTQKNITLGIFLAISFLLTINNMPDQEKFDNGTVASKTIQDMLKQAVNGYSPNEIKDLLNKNVDTYYAGAKEFSNSLDKHPNMVDDIVRGMAKDSNVEKFEDSADDVNEQFETFEDEVIEDQPVETFEDEVIEDQPVETFEDEVIEDQPVETFEAVEVIDTQDPNEGFYANNFSNCKSFYVPSYESVNDICNPVTTFDNNSYNAQGINNLMGFDRWNIKGSEIQI